MPTYTLIGLSGSGYVYAGGASINSTLYLGQDTSWSYQSMLAFDTSTLEGTITSVTLIMRGNADASTVDFTIEARLHDWGTTCTSADWVPGASLESKLLLATAPTLGFSTSVDTTFTSESAFITNINRAGITRCLLSSSRQRLGLTPTGTEYVGFREVSAGTGIAPRLVIVTTIGSPQTVTMGAIESISTVSEPVVEQGFNVPHPPSLPYTAAVGIPQLLHIYPTLHGYGVMAVTASRNGIIRAYLDSPVHVLAGHTYSAAAYFRSGNRPGAEALIGIEWRDANGGLLSLLEGLTVTTINYGWVESLIDSVIAPTNAVAARLMLEFRGVVADDVNFVTEPWLGQGAFIEWAPPNPNVVMNIHDASIVGGEVGTPIIGYQMRSLIFPPSIETDQNVPAPHLYELIGAATGVPSAEAFGVPTLIMRTDWWSGRWPYRRAVAIVAPPAQEVPVGHPIAVRLSTMVHTQGKLRDDFADIEVLHLVDDMWWRLPRSVIQIDDEIEIRFLTDVALLPTGEDVYHIYHGALASTGEGRAPFVDNPWPIVVPYDDSDVSYTKPREHWRQGITSTPGARATLEFDGIKVRMVSLKGPDDAMAEVQLDSGPWQKVDLYSPTEVVAEVVRWESLSPTDHKLRVRAVGRRNPSSVGLTVDLPKFEYVTSVDTTVGAEEVLVTGWRGSGVGGG